MPKWAVLHGKCWHWALVVVFPVQGFSLGAGQVTVINPCYMAATATLGKSLLCTFLFLMPIIGTILCKEVKELQAV